MYKTIYTKKRVTIKEEVDEVICDLCGSTADKINCPSPKNAVTARCELRVKKDMTCSIVLHLCNKCMEEILKPYKNTKKVYFLEIFKQLNLWSDKK